MHLNLYRIEQEHSTIAPTYSVGLPKPLIGWTLRGVIEDRKMPSYLIQSGDTGKLVVSSMETLWIWVRTKIN